MCEPTETAQSSGYDTHAVVARLKWAWEHGLRTGVVHSVVGWIALPIDMCSNKDAGKSDRKTPTPCATTNRHSTQKKVGAQNNSTEQNKTERPRVQHRWDISCAPSRLARGLVRQKWPHRYKPRVRPSQPAIRTKWGASALCFLICTGHTDAVHRDGATVPLNFFYHSPAPIGRQRTLFIRLLPVV